jgi:hypothetical protein
VRQADPHVTRYNTPPGRVDQRANCDKSGVSATECKKKRLDGHVLIAKPQKSDGSGRNRGATITDFNRFAGARR